jgi:CubicO group peptidase (beta-lactamase class C family)
MLMRHTAPTVLALLLMAVPALAQNPRDSAVAAVDRAFENYRGTSVPGCAVAVSRDGNVVLERAYGMANLETSTPIQPGTIFHVASVSKQFTAMAILLLAKDGRLSLDDDIRKHLPEIPDYGPTITIRHLLNHTSGLRDQWDLLALARGRFEENRITEADVLDIVPRQKALNFMPGAEYMYSNTGYTLAAVIVKRVSGRSLRAFAHERIFAPLGMNDTHFHDDFTMVVPGRAWAYVPAFGAATNFRTSVPNYDTYGATSLFTTVGDLLKWERNFTTMKVGDAALFTEMHRNGRLNGGDSTGYALGVGVGAYRGARIVEHTGGDAGYRSYLGRFPDQKLAIALACNTSTANVSALPRRIADIYIGDLLATQSPPVTPQGVALTAEQLRGRAGAYFQPTLVQFAEITFRDGKLFLGAHRQQRANPRHRRPVQDGHRPGRVRLQAGGLRRRLAEYRPGLVLRAQGADADIAGGDAAVRRRVLQRGVERDLPRGRERYVDHHPDGDQRSHPGAISVHRYFFGAQLHPAVRAFRAPGDRLRDHDRPRTAREVRAGEIAGRDLKDQRLANRRSRTRPRPRLTAFTVPDAERRKVTSWPLCVKASL